MSYLEILIEVLKAYEIDIVAVEGKHIKLQNNFEIEVEKNKLYKLISNGNIIAPFNDLNELCRFILMYMGK